MNKQNTDFYGNLGQEKYLLEVRRFVPKYDQLVKLVSSRIVKLNPQNILDIGAGVGNVDFIVLSELENARITCVEPQEPMVKACKRTLGKYGERAKVVTATAQDFSYDEKYDAAFSNLALHNIPSDEKQRVVSKIRGSLKDGAPFIWSDLINYGGLTQELLVGYRHVLAFLKGASFGFVLEDLRKERTQDSKLSVEETIVLCEQVGFRNPRLIWQTHQGTAGIFYMEK
jgi:SAM-dependent methyltransferase